jgi:hypothetical protein
MNIGFFKSISLESFIKRLESKERRGFFVQAQDVMSMMLNSSYNIL